MIKQLRKFTGNCIEYLGGEAPQETTPTPSGDKAIWVDMTLDGNNIVDQVSGSTLTVNDAKAQRENVAGAAGSTLRRLQHIRHWQHRCVGTERPDDDRLRMGGTGKLSYG